MKTLGFIGMGNMAGAIAAGILQKGLMKKEEVFAYAPHYEKLEANAEKIGFVPCKDLTCNKSHCLNRLIFYAVLQNEE